MEHVTKEKTIDNFNVVRTRMKLMTVAKWKLFQQLGWQKHYIIVSFKMH